MNQITETRNNGKKLRAALTEDQRPGANGGWCGCPHGSLMDSVFYSDCEHDVIKKHHYRCHVCDGILQIG